MQPNDRLTESGEDPEYDNESIDNISAETNNDPISQPSTQRDQYTLADPTTDVGGMPAQPSEFSVSSQPQFGAGTEGCQSVNMAQQYSDGPQQYTSYDQKQQANNLQQPNPRPAYDEASDVSVASASGAGLYRQPKPKFFARKPVIISLVAAFIALAGSAIFVFGYYLPNTPERVWDTALGRSGDQLTAIVELFEDPQAQETFNKAKMTLNGSVSGVTDGESYESELTLGAVSDDTTSQGNAGLTAKSNDLDYDLSAEFKTSLPDGAIVPNIYFKLSGLSSLGLDAYLPEVLRYDDTWIAVEQDFIEENFADQIRDIKQSSSGDREDIGDVTYEDIVSIVGDVNEVTQEYVFTSDPGKSVIILDDFVATEESEGIKANHYKAKISKENSTKYCEALVDKLSANEGMKKFFDDEEGFMDAMNDSREKCDEYDPDFDWDQAYDIWIDKKYKLFHKLRVYESFEDDNQRYRERESECVEGYASYDYLSDVDIAKYCNYDDFIVEGDSYSEVGQVYRGGSTFVMFSNIVTDTNKQKSTGRVDVTIDTQSLSASGGFDFTYDNPENDDSMRVKASLSTEPYSGDIDASKPDGAISIEEVIRGITGSNTLPFDDIYENDVVFDSGFAT